MDYTDWLGPADLTDDQRDCFTAAADAYYDLPMHAGRDPEDVIADTAEDDAALTAILQAILREDSLMGAARRARQATADLDGWVRDMSAMGWSEHEIARDSGLSRITVRSRLGK
ncbi:MAG: hypothetical protein Q4G40_09200 [Brachybacterium sp.]|nr:hypothetical protein [Brachybacterium sp.]